MIQNQLELLIECPEGIEVTCDSHYLESDISEYLQRYIVIGPDNYEVNSNFDFDEIDINTKLYAVIFEIQIEVVQELIP